MKHLFFIGLLLCAAVIPAKAQSLYADPRAHDVGDVVTVVLAERTSASRESGWDNRSATQMGGNAGVAGNVTGRFGLDASFNNEALNKNLSSQRDLLTGTFTAQVIERDERGNLMIAGERRLHVNGETHLLRVEGLVRPFDVRNDNSVYSFQIANANIEYRHAGAHRRFVKPGFLARVGAATVLGAAIIIASQN